MRPTRLFVFTSTLALGAFLGSGCSDDTNVVGGSPDAKVNTPDARVVDGSTAITFDAPATTTKDAPITTTPDASTGGSPDASTSTTPDAGSPDAAIGPTFDAPPPVVKTAYRIETLTLQDPQAVVVSTATVDGLISGALTGDADNDGNFDLSPVIVLEPKVTDNDATTTVELVFANCTKTNTTCTGTAKRFSFTATTKTTGTCLTPVANTVTTGNTPNQPAALCFSTDAHPFSLSLTSTISLSLTGGQFGATFSDDTHLMSGLLFGYLATPPIPGLFAAGDSDTGPGGATGGWYLYTNFTATQVPYSEP